MSDRSPGQSRRSVLLGTAFLLLAACGRTGNQAVTSPAGTPDASAARGGSLEWAVNGDWRAADRPRDRFLHPIETLRFFDLKPDMEVVQLWPGRGLWTEILAPYLARNGGSLYAANFQLGEHPDPAEAAIVERFKARFSDHGRYGDVHMTEFGPTSGPIAPAGSADLVLFMLSLHEWMAAGLADKAFRDAFAALKPGGILGVVQHRANIGGLQDPTAVNGYVQEPYVKRLAAEAGFDAHVDSSEVNANPKDGKDHPFGVWTLPPDRLSAPRGSPPDPNFNHAKYDLIGESDRMTLKFRKPA